MILIGDGSETVMEAKEFQALVEQMGDLTEVQRSALAAALAGKGSANEAIALIEMRFSAAPVSTPEQNCIGGPEQ